MLQGAIIGLIVGLVMTVVMTSKQKKRKERFFKALDNNGPEAARTVLDTEVKPLAKLPMNSILDQQDRMAGLAIIGDLQTLETEIAGHTGKLVSVAQVNAIGLLGVTIRADDPADGARRLEELATRMESEGGATTKLVKKKVRNLANLARSITGQMMPPDTSTAIQQMTTREPQLVRVLLCQGMVRAISAAGGDPAEMRARVQKDTRAFDS